MKFSYILIGLLFIALAFSGAKYYQVYLDTEQFLHEFKEIEYPDNPELETDISSRKVFSHTDESAVLLFIRKNKEQYFVTYRRAGASDILKRFSDWEFKEVEKVRNSDGKFVRYYFPIYL